MDKTPQPAGGEEMQRFRIVPQSFQPPEMKLSKQIDISISVKVANLLEGNTTTLELHFDSRKVLTGAKGVS
jgi:hypothetical protein